jgi:hypothetical protein
MKYRRRDVRPQNVCDVSSVMDGCNELAVRLTKSRTIMSATIATSVPL